MTYGDVEIQSEVFNLLEYGNCREQMITREYLRREEFG
jgi:hypothetical protein